MIPKRLASTLVVALLSTLAVACPGSSGSGDDSGIDGGEKPFQSEWEMVVNAPFPLADIGNVTIGRKEYMENFANRGDVEVFFDLPTETITIEMRRYAFQLDQAEADDTFSRIQPWAFVASGSPKKPSEMDPADDCTAAWQEGCAFYVYYDGQSQPARTGADIRVHLPAAYRAKVFVETEDNTTETLYPLRGDVKLQNLCGSGDVRVSSGVVDVFLCRELTPGPTCSADAISKCETWQIDDGMGNMVDAPWDSTCPCTSFGALKVEALDPYAANVTVDIPNSVWAYINLDNRKSGQTPDGYHCTAEVDPSVCGAGCTVTQSPETPWKALVDLNFPGPSATTGAGYSVNVVSNGCEGVFYADGPSDYNPDADKPEKEEDRGNIKLCTGCLAAGG